MSDESGEFPVGSLNDWELKVLDAEMQEPDFLAWYRNPSRASEDSLAIAYQDDQGNWRRMCPDFLFFHGDEREIRVSIVDPHGFHLADALSKLRGLHAFAKQYGEAFHRIEAIAKIEDDTLRVLDLKDPTMSDALETANDAKSRYLGKAASDY